MHVRLSSGLLRCLSAVPDPRSFNVTYNLPTPLSYILMALPCGCNDYEEITGWTVGVLGLPADRCPCRRSFERLPRRLNRQRRGFTSPR